ncbi:3-oxoacyl-ACP reductase family protein [Streptomyces sp. NPDC059861]|uniref:3-oxoacyl-ACP reductase family protein n=1 Tax=Streptomyces sp. NPDC059861 TaxID=3346974 RepID=UPI0036489D80
MSHPLQGKNALVTGGSRGIGAAIARHLAQAGAAVAVTYHSSPDRAEALVRQIAGDGGTAVAIQADASDRVAARSAVTETVKQLGGLDIVVNNAGASGVGPIEEVTDETYDHAVAVNVGSVFHTTREALRHMTSGSRVITVGSINADRIHFAGGTVYALTKAAVAGFSRALAREVSSRAITVNTVQPGPVDTEMNPADSDFAKITRPLIATGRYGTADEIASVVTFLAGPDASFITGATINVDGGFAA